MTAKANRPRSRKRNSWTTRARRITQLLFAGFIVFAAARHQLAEGAGVATPSIDALCPFGAVETLGTYITTGNYISKIHPSDIVLALGVLIGLVLAGNAFCGWICPFGAVQDGINWVRRKLRLPEVTLPERVDSILRYGRFVTLALIVYMSMSTAKLWFADYDPYRTLFSLHWLYAFNLATMWPALVILGAVLGLSLLVERAWCRYLCPLGGVLSVFGHLSILRIRRSEDSCKGCALCESPCPVGLKVATANPTVSTNCVGCLECVEACPRHGALTLQIGPRWWDGLKSLWLRQPVSTN